MDAPERGFAICDAHVHFFSEFFFSVLARQKGCDLPKLQADLGWELPGNDNGTLANRWVAELDRNAVARACLITSVPADEESVLSAVRQYPERFYAYAMCDPTAPDAHARTQNALRSGLRGVCLFPGMQRYSMHDERVLAIAELVANTPGALVFVHCGVLSVGVRNKLGLPSPFDLRYSNPVDLHAIALQFPRVPSVIPHFGAGYLREALMVCDLCPNVHLDTSSTNSWVRYHAPELTLRQVFERALEVVGPQRLLFGTDSSYFPRGWHGAIYRQQALILDELGVPLIDRAAIFGGNLERLVGHV